MNQPQRIGNDVGEKKVLADINEYGWHVTNVIEDDDHPPWSFTIGLFETWNHPELIIVGAIPRHIPRNARHRYRNELHARSHRPRRLLASWA